MSWTKTHLVPSAILCSASITFAASMPDLAEMRAAMANAGPIHLYEDENGVFSPQFEAVDSKKTPEYGIRKHYLGEKDWAFLRDIGARTEIESVKQQASTRGLKSTSPYTCTTTTVPSSVTLTYHYTLGVVYGGVNVCGLTRPSGTHTQTLDLEFWSYQYSGAGAHMPLATWFKSTFHAQGMYIGHAAPGSTCPGTSASSNYNSSFEWWSLWQDEAPPSQSDVNKWHATGTDLFDSSCGSLLYDSTSSSTPTVKYRVQYEANDSGNNAYVIYQWNGSSWVTVTGPVYATYTWSTYSGATGPGVFDANANGVGFGSTASPGWFAPPSYPGWWVMNLSNISNSWY